MSDLILRGGLALTPGGPRKLDVRIVAGTVAEVGEHLDTSGVDVIDATNAWVGPGFVDLHVHLREPGQEHKEDIATGSAAAAAGGYTAIVAMPNTDPPVDRGHLARYVHDRGREVGLVDVRSAGCLTAGREGRALAHLDELWAAGVRVFSDDGDTVADGGVLRRAMEYLVQLGGVVSQHAVDPGLARGGHMHEGPLSSRLGMQGIPALAEDVIVARDLALVRLTGCRYHLQHVATASSIDLVRAAKAEGLPVTAEVTPHHLAFDETHVANTDPSFKMMPPLRSEHDVEALRAALVDGTVDVVATDHAPHAPHEKDVPFEHAPFGITGLEWAAAVVNSTVELDPQPFFERMSVTAALIGGIDGHGRWIEPGVEANLVVFDPNDESVATVSQSRSTNAPYLGRAWRGAVRHTLLRGVVTHASVGPVTA